MKRNINSFLSIGLIVTFTLGSAFLVNIININASDNNIYWTHPQQKLKYSESKNYFELYINDKNLTEYLDDNSLALVQKDEKYISVLQNNITIRINNWYKEKSELLNTTVYLGIGLGAALTLLIIGIYKFVNERKNNINESLTD